jgi:hypothetical protein
MGGGHSLACFHLGPLTTEEAHRPFASSSPLVTTLLLPNTHHTTTHRVRPLAVMKPIAILVAAAALAGCGVEAFQPRAHAPRMSAAAAPKAATAGADKKSEEPLLLRAAKGEVRVSVVCFVGAGGGREEEGIEGCVCIMVWCDGRVLMHRRSGVVMPSKNIHPYIPHPSPPVP